jgi:aryl-alcohol dehydrogenase-like predicted oxidoreductase
MRNRTYNREYLAKIQPLIGLLKEVGQEHGGKTPAEVSLNWLICKGAIPIPGAKNLKQVQDNLGALGWRLSDAEVTKLDRTSDQLIGK